MDVHKKWKGLIYNSLEQCSITTLSDSIEIRSAIAGHFEDKIFDVAYFIKTSLNWQTIMFSISGKNNDKDFSTSYTADGNGKWFQEEQKIPAFSSCIDIDISVSPLTNTLPVKRLNLSLNDDAIIGVLYIDVLAGIQKKVQQKYTRLSANEYKYENVPNDFEAIISLDGDGFVNDYPGLFIAL